MRGVHAARGPKRINMGMQPPGNAQHLYICEIITTSPVNDYIVRIIPNFKNISVRWKPTWYDGNIDLGY